MNPTTDAGRHTVCSVCASTLPQCQVIHFGNAKYEFAFAENGWLVPALLYTLPGCPRPKDDFFQEAWLEKLGLIIQMVCGNSLAHCLRHCVAHSAVLRVDASFVFSLGVQARRPDGDVRTLLPDAQPLERYVKDE